MIRRQNVTAHLNVIKRPRGYAQNVKSLFINIPSLIHPMSQASTGPFGSRIHSTYRPAHWVIGPTATFGVPLGWIHGTYLPSHGELDPWHLSAIPLGNRSTAPIRRPIGWEIDPRHLSAIPLENKPTEPICRPIGN